MMKIAAGVGSLGDGVMPTEFDMTIYCSHPRFRQTPAKYKIAAEWTGGDYKELKTYGFADNECLIDVYLAATERAGQFRPCEGETLGELQIFVLDSSRHDYELERAVDLETRVKAVIAKETKTARKK